MDEFFGTTLATRGAPRTVVTTDPHAGFLGAELGERTLLPGADAVPGETSYLSAGHAHLPAPGWRRGA